MRAEEANARAGEWTDASIEAHTIAATAIMEQAERVERERPAVAARLRYLAGRHQYQADWGGTT
jgi:hypothetical protein